MSLLLSLFIGIGLTKILALPTFLGIALGFYLYSYNNPQRASFQWYHFNQDQFQAAFNHHCFGLMGCLAKADGIISRQEILEAEAIMAERGFNHTQKSLAKSSFQSGSKGLNLANTISYLKTLKFSNPSLLQVFFAYQERIIHADNNSKMQQLNILNQIKFRVFNQERSYQRTQGQTFTPNKMNQAYKVLGVNADTPYSDMKKAYRKLVGKHHPDRARSEAEKKRSEETVKRIHNAWKTIKSHHKEPA